MPLRAEATKTVKRCSMKLGGHAPVVICNDADVVAAADLCGQFKFRNAGQVYIAPNRFYVHEMLPQNLLTKWLKSPMPRFA